VFFGEINDFCEIFLFCKPAVIKIILAFNIFFVDSVSSLEINEILEWIRRGKNKKPTLKR
jgi:hypothetical protein